MKNLSTYLFESFNPFMINESSLAPEIDTEELEKSYEVFTEKGYGIASKISSSRPELFYHKGSNLLVAAPHHSTWSNNKKTMISLKGNPRDYDQNTGFIALNVAKALGASYLIFNNAPEDPNKIVTNKYCTTIQSARPKLHVEIHGHGGRFISDETIEISGGLKNNAMSVKFAELMRIELDKNGLDYVKCLGDFNEIFYKASKTPTINGQIGSYKALHIELGKPLRTDAMVNKMSKIITNVLKQLA